MINWAIKDQGTRFTCHTGWVRIYMCLWYYYEAGEVGVTKQYLAYGLYKLK